jgi:hypothetical protein
MGRPYSLELRERVIAAVDQGAAGRRRNLEWASIRPFSGCGASVRRAALHRARWVGKSRRRFRLVAGTDQGVRLHLSRAGRRTRRRGLKVDYRSV